MGEELKCRIKLETANNLQCLDIAVDSGYLKNNKLSEQNSNLIYIPQKNINLEFLLLIFSASTELILALIKFIF